VGILRTDVFFSLQSPDLYGDWDWFHANSAALERLSLGVEGLWIPVVVGDLVCWSTVGA
jgi:hypothetical protein